MRDLIEKWIDEFVSVHNEDYGQIPCPYARAAQIKYIKTDNIDLELKKILDCGLLHEVICIYTDTRNYTPDEFHDKVMEWNNMAMKKDLVALEDHPESVEIINGTKMNFGHCSLILVQRLSKLTAASNTLKKKGYYDNWTQENLDEVVTWREK